MSGETRPNERRALRSLLRYREPGQTPHRRITPTMKSDLLRWAASISDEELLDIRNIGPTLLRWIRDHQPPYTIEDYGTPVRMIPEAVVGSTFGEVIKRTGWRVELFWNGSGGWFTARMISPWDRDGNRSYPGGFLAPFDDPIGTSGSTPAEALANLSEAVLEWA